jgi:hypothetical protein
MTTQRTYRRNLGALLIQDARPSRSMGRCANDPGYRPATEILVN